VGKFPANGFDLHDTAGNVWEWVQDCWHENYTNAPVEGNVPWLGENGGDCGRRVLRGGSWYFVPQDVRSASRAGDAPDNRSSTIGFRLAQDL
jgi:formylglycine-generating enzyme required for sulfatase activity